MELPIARWYNRVHYQDAILDFLLILILRLGIRFLCLEQNQILTGIAQTKKSVKMIRFYAQGIDTNSIEFEKVEGHHHILQAHWQRSTKALNWNDKSPQRVLIANKTTNKFIPVKVDLLLKTHYVENTVQI